MLIGLYCAIYLLIGFFWAFLVKDAIGSEDSKKVTFLSIFLWPVDVLLGIAFDLYDKFREIKKKD